MLEPANNAGSGDRADLVTTKRPNIRLADMTLAPATRTQLGRVLYEQRQRDVLASHGFAPLRRLLLTGSSGTGKSTSAAALAAELSLPLVTVRLDTLTSKYAGETAVKLRVIYAAMTHPRAVYLLDGLAAIEARLTSLHDLGEARRIVNMFLTFLDENQPDSLTVAVADHPSLLDAALLRRFDAIVSYYLPDPAQALALLRRRLAAVNTSAVSWDEVANHVKSLTQGALVRAAKSATKQAVLSHTDSLSTAALITSLTELRTPGNAMGFSRT